MVLDDADDADAPVERIAPRDGAPWLVLTCEHGSNHLPAPWTWSAADRRLVDMHWASDIGVAPLVRRLAAQLGAPAVLAGFTRLLVDPNRPLGAETMFRAMADGLPVTLNTGLTDAERQARIEGFYEPYHRAVDEAVLAAPGADVLSLHSFTPLYEGQPRQVQIGVLFDEDEELAQRWLKGLSGHGYDVRPNEPWSGREGLMYSPQRHAVEHGRRAIELELRQDLLVDPHHAVALASLVADVARAIHAPAS